MSKEGCAMQLEVKTRSIYFKLSWKALGYVIVTVTGLYLGYPML
jgi:hypothetical protein